MKGRREDPALAHEDGFAVPARQDLDFLAGAADPRRPDEHARVVGLEDRLERVDLTPERISLDVDVDEPPRRLIGIRDPLREEDRAGARAEHRAAARHKAPDRFLDARSAEEV